MQSDSFLSQLHYLLVYDPENIPHISVPQFPHLKNWCVNSTYPKDWCEEPTDSF